MRTHGIRSPARIVEILRTSHSVATTRKTVKDDIDALTAETSLWWRHSPDIMHEAIRQFYTDESQEIAELKSMSTKMLSSDPEIHPDLMALLGNISDVKQQASLIKHLQAVYGAAQIQRYAGKVAYIHSIITEKRNAIIGMMTDWPLYDQTKKLSDYYRTHREAVKPVSQ